MTSGNPLTAPHGRTRMLEVRTWLGAGALALGVGAALAGAAGVAQADTGRNQPSSSASDSKPDAGPARAAAASAKRVSTPVAGVTSTAVSARGAKVATIPVSASAVSRPSAKAKPAAAVTAKAIAGQLFNQTIDTPFGPITLAADVSAPDLGQSGPLSLNATATTPIGNAKFALAGTTTFTTSPLKSTNTLTSGTIEVPSAVAFVASVAGAVVNAGLTAYGSLQSFVTAVSSGNIIGAIGAWAEAAPKFTNALLFGAGTLDLPLQNGSNTGPGVVAHIPVGGLFAPLRPISVSWGDYSSVDPGSGAEIAIVGGSIDFAGTQLGGAAPAFFKIFGI